MDGLVEPEEDNGRADDQQGWIQYPLLCSFLQEQFSS